MIASNSLPAAGRRHHRERGNEEGLAAEYTHFPAYGPATFVAYEQLAPRRCGGHMPSNAHTNLLAKHVFIVERFQIKPVIKGVATKVRWSLSPL
jgi:hypothetical protein